MASRRSNTFGDSSLKPLSRWENDQDEDYCNPDKLLMCPYDPSHQIRAYRFPYHLIKCKKNHPQLASVLWTCPFNARHLMPKHELSHHIANCVDRCSISSDCVETVQSKFQVPVNTWTIPACYEDWEQEIEEPAAPPAQIDGRVSTSQLSSARPEHGMVNGFTPCLRAPRVLPWTLSK